MRSSHLASLCFCLCLSVLPSPVRAAVIAFFDNATYTDPAQESARLAASLTELGHTINIFSGITAADFQTATAAADILVIPELDNGSLFPDLDSAARTAIMDYVAGGGRLLMFDRSDAPTPEMLNGLFGFALATGSGGVTTRNDADVAGTLLAAGPGTLPASDATEAFTTASLPAGAINAYDDGAGNTTVFLVDVGQGQVGYLGFDWFEDPAPAEWEHILGVTMAELTTPPPTPEHMQCYQAKDLKNPKFVAQPGQAVIDQFQTSSIEVKKPAFVCAPSTLNGSTVDDPDTHVCCYKSKGVKLSPAVDVETVDTFGTVQQQLKSPKMFCTPCTKTLLP